MNITTLMVSVLLMTAKQVNTGTDILMVHVNVHPENNGSKILMMEHILVNWFVLIQPNTIHTLVSVMKMVYVVNAYVQPITSTPYIMQEGTQGTIKCLILILVFAKTVVISQLVKYLMVPRAFVSTIMMVLVKNGILIMMLVNVQVETKNTSPNIIVTITAIWMIQFGILVTTSVNAQVLINTCSTMIFH
jgi:hypothetical protein